MVAVAAAEVGAAVVVAGVVVQVAGVAVQVVMAGVAVQVAAVAAVARVRERRVLLDPRVVPTVEMMVGEASSDPEDPAVHQMHAGPEAEVAEVRRVAARKVAARKVAAPGADLAEVSGAQQRRRVWAEIRLKAGRPSVSSCWREIDGSMKS